MNFDFSDEQKFLKAEARKFLEAKAPLSLAHAVLDNPANVQGRALWSEITEQGWTGLTIPEEFGGLGLGGVELCAISEELGRSLAPVPFASTIYLFAEALLLAGSEAQKSKHLPEIAAGNLIGCFAGASLQSTTAKGNVLSGFQMPVIDGMDAHAAIVLAADGAGGHTLFVVELAQVQRSAIACIDPTRSIARLDFEGVSGEQLGEAGQGLALMEAIYERAAVPIAFEQIGGADRCLELARDFSLGRFAFGRAIGSYQAIKHKLADIYIKNQLARSNSYYGAWALSVRAPELRMAAAAARLSATDAFWYAAKESLHVFGGIGFTWESDCQLFYRRSQLLGLTLGPSRAWKDRLVNEVIRTRATA